MDGLQMPHVQTIQQVWYAFSKWQVHLSMQSVPVVPIV